MVDLYVVAGLVVAGLSVGTYTLTRLAAKAYFAEKRNYMKSLLKSFK